jgi:hypothetical protein
MALMQDPILPQRRTSAPDYETEADQGRLKLRGDPLRTSSELSPPRTLAEEILAGFRADEVVNETSFELESPGGHARTVTGTIAYLDEQAHTFMVREPDWALSRVPLRDITSTHVAATGERDRLRLSYGNVDGLGAGQDQPSRRTSQPARIR